MSIPSYFDFKGRRTGYRQEFLAGATTFLPFAYIIVVNPAILEAAGIPKGPSMTATILTAIAGTFLMGVYAKRPFAVAPYMGENAFIAYTVVHTLGYSWQTALAAIFYQRCSLYPPDPCGAPPVACRIHSNLTQTQLLPSASASFWRFSASATWASLPLEFREHPCAWRISPGYQSFLSLLGLLATAVLLVRNVRGAILIAMGATTGAFLLFGLIPVPPFPVSLPPSIAPIWMQINFQGALVWGFAGVVTSVLIMDFVDTMGSLFGLSSRAGLLDAEGTSPTLKKPMLVDALSTVIASLFGTTTAGIYIESATGIEQGGRTGFTAIVVAGFLFLRSFSPLLTIVPLSPTDRPWSLSAHS